MAVTTPDSTASEEQLQALKEQLALACRMLANERLFDHSGHISARHPVNPEYVLIHPHPTSRYQVRAEDILTVDADGNVVEGDLPRPSEIAIHTRIYRARPDVNSVCHVHARMTTVASIAGRPLVAVTNYGAYLGSKPVPVYDNPRLVHSVAAGDALAEALGDRPACLMRAHGGVVVGGSVRDAFVRSIYLEENALRAHLAWQVADGPLRGFTDEELKDVAGAGWREGPVKKVWDYHLSRAQQAGLA